MPQTLSCAGVLFYGMKLSNPLRLNNHILTQQISPKKSYSLFATGSSFFQSGNTPSPFSLTSPPPPLSSPFSPTLLSPSPSPLPTPPHSPPPLSLLRSSVNTLTSLALSSELLSSSSVFVCVSIPSLFSNHLYFYLSFSLLLLLIKNKLCVARFTRFEFN